MNCATSLVNRSSKQDTYRQDTNQSVQRLRCTLVAEWGFDADVLRTEMSDNGSRQERRGLSNFGPGYPCSSHQYSFLDYNGPVNIFRWFLERDDLDAFEGYHLFAHFFNISLFP